MDPSKFLLLNVIMGLAMVASIYALKYRKRRPTLLNLRARANPIAEPFQPPVVLSQKETEFRGTQLNIFFAFNGHEWDAFEALGIPAGCSIQTAEEAYLRVTASLESDGKLFYDLAIQAIRRHRAA